MVEDLNYFQNYIDKKGYLSIKDWYNRLTSRNMFEKSITLGLIDKIKFKENYELKSHSFEDVQEFINQKFIRNLENLKTRFLDVYDIVIKNQWRSILKFFNTTGVDYSWINTINDFKEFIKVKEINGRNDLIKRARTIYNKSVKLGWIDLIFPPTQRKPIKWKTFLKVQEDVDKFFIDQDIKDKNDLTKKFPGLPGFLRENNFKTNYTKEKINWSDKIYDNITSEKFFKENDIKDKEDINIRFPGLYWYLISNKIETYFSMKVKRLEAIKLVKDETKLKKFFQDNNIKTSKDLHLRFNFIESIMYELGISTRGFCLGTNGFDSSWEEEIFNTLLQNIEIENLKHNINLGCKDKLELPFDIVFSYKNSNYIIEILGPSHFTKNRYGIKHYIMTRKHDLMKYKWAKKNNYKLIYLTIREGINLLNTYKYPFFVYTKLNNILQDIKNNII